MAFHKEGKISNSICLKCGNKIENHYGIRKYCSQICFYSSLKGNQYGRLIKNRENCGFKKGEKHFGWKGGRGKTSTGYIEIYSPNHPFRNKVTNRIFEHRLLMEKKIGRFLNPKEVVHHINGKRDDNRIENLLLITTNEHCAEHNSKRVHTPECKEKHRQNAMLRQRNEHGGFVKCITP